MLAVTGNFKKNTLEGKELIKHKSDYFYYLFYLTAVFAVNHHG